MAETPAPTGNEPPFAFSIVSADSPLFEKACDVRRLVFIEEQGFPEDGEWDEYDAKSIHIIAMAGAHGAGTLRFFDDDGWLHVGRVAVLSKYRGAGLGRLLMERCLEEGERRGFAKSFLNAQSDKSGFYEKLGYRRVGEEFLELDVPHYRMEREL